MASARPRDQQLSLIAEILTDTRKYNVGYAQDAKVLIEWHLQTLLTRVASLSVKYEDYTYNDGRTVGMIKLTGTIPIIYIQVKYNIPVTIWISEHYPKQAPIAYVTPTANMIIKDRHPHVDRSGAVHTPYIMNWHHDISDLVGMVMDMATAFGQEPPLYAKAAPAPPQTSTRFYPSPMDMTPNPQMQGYSPGPSSGLTATTAYHSPNSYPQPDYYPMPQKPKPKPEPKDPKEHLQQMKSQYREALMHSLTERVHQSLSLLNRSIAADSQAEADNTTLKDHTAVIQHNIDMLQAERETYEHNVKVMAMMIGAMTEWKSNLDIADDVTGSDLRPQDIIVPDNPIDGQLLKLQAEDLAAEDCLTALDSLFQKECIDLENYLKQIKKVCRSQYYARALTMKIHQTHNRQH